MCLPSEAEAEIERTPWPLLLDIMEKRAFARTRADLKAMKSELEADKSPAVMLVWSVQALAWRRRVSEGRV